MFSSKIVLWKFLTPPTPQPTPTATTTTKTRTMILNIHITMTQKELRIVISGQILVTFWDALYICMYVGLGGRKCQLMSHLQYAQVKMIMGGMCLEVIATKINVNMLCMSVCDNLSCPEI